MPELGDPKKTISPARTLRFYSHLQLRLFYLGSLGSLLLLLGSLAEPPFPPGLVVVFLILAAFYQKTLHKSLLRVRVFETGFMLRNKAVKNSSNEWISFSQIRRVETRFPGWLWGRAGFVLYGEGDKKVSFSSDFQGTFLILDRIVEKRPDLFAHFNYSKLKEILILEDHFMARVFGRSSLQRLLRVRLGAPLILSGLLLVLQAREVQISHPWSHLVFLFFTGSVCSIFILRAAESFITVFLHWKMRNRLQTNPQEEGAIGAQDRLTRWFVLGTQLLGMILFYGDYYKSSSNWFTSFQVAGSNPNLGLHSGDRIWIDFRYNCLDCKYSLEKGDLVRSFGALVGVLVGVPGDRILVNRSDDQVHLFAAEDQILPPGKVGLQVWERDRGVNLLVDMKDVEGLISRNYPSFRPAPFAWVPPSVAVTAPRRGVEIFAQCSPKSVTPLMSQIQGALEKSGPLIRQRDYRTVLTVFETLVRNLKREVNACPSVLAAIEEDLAVILSFEREADRAWLAHDVFQGVLNAGSENSRKLAALSRKPWSDPTQFRGGR